MKKSASEYGADLVRVRHEMQTQGALPSAIENGPELALFVIWEKARSFQDKILEAIAIDFEIRGVHEITWTPDRVSENFSRFYQGAPAPPYGTRFQAMKGTGPFLVIPVVDPKPQYETRDTHRGPEVLNIKCFDFKQRVRKLVGGLMRVHSTDSAAEASRDMLMLLGIAPEKYLDDHRESWQGNIDKIHRDLSGADGWGSMAELLQMLNHGLRYIVMRNFEDLPDAYEIGHHLDVDLLTDNYHEMVRLLHARPMYRSMPRWGGRFLGRVNGAEVIFDIRCVSDGYYDAAWSERLLKRRQWQAGGFFGPAPDDYFESLAYHAIIHKWKLQDDYRERLPRMAEALGIQGWNNATLASFESAVPSLNKLMANRGFLHVRPKDPTVYYNFSAAGYQWPWFQRKLGGLRQKIFVRWSRFSYPFRFFWASARRRLVRLLPGLRLLKPDYRRIRSGPSKPPSKPSNDHPTDSS